MSLCQALAEMGTSWGRAVSHLRASWGVSWKCRGPDNTGWDQAWNQLVPSWFPAGYLLVPALFRPSVPIQLVSGGLRTSPQPVPSGLPARHHLLPSWPSNQARLQLLPIWPPARSPGRPGTHGPDLPPLAPIQDPARGCEGCRSTSFGVVTPVWVARMVCAAPALSPSRIPGQRTSSSSIHSSSPAGVHCQGPLVTCR